MTDIEQKVDELSNLMEKMEHVADKLIELRHGPKHGKYLGASDGYEFNGTDIEYSISDIRGDYVASGSFPMSYLFDPNWEEAEKELSIKMHQEEIAKKKKAGQLAKRQQDANEKSQLKRLAKKHNMTIVKQKDFENG